MTHILFMNPGWGVDYMLQRKLGKEEIPFEYVSPVGTSEDKVLCKRHEIRMTPVLLVLDNDVVVDKLVTIDEIMDYLKKANSLIE